VNILSPYFLKRELPPLQDQSVISDLPIAPLELNIRDYWLTIRKHFTLITSFLLVAAFGTALILFQTTPIYTATSTLLIERNAPQVLDLRQVLVEPISSEEFNYYKTQYEILRSDGIATEVLRQLNLEQDLLPADQVSARGLFARLRYRFSHWLGSTGIARFAPSPVRRHRHFTDEGGQEVKPRLLEKYLKDLEIEPITGTRLVRVHFNSVDPELSARVANTHAEIYIRQGLELNRQTTREAQRFLEEKLVELKDRVEKSEAALNMYRRDHGILSLNDKEDVVVQRLDELNKNLTAAEGERISLEALVRQIQSNHYDWLPAVVSNELIQRLKQESSRLEGEYTKLATRFKAGYEPLDELKNQFDRTKGRLDDEIQKVAESVQTSYQAAVIKEKELRAKMDEQKSIALAQKNTGVEYAILAREADTNRQLYDSVLQRMKETEVESDARVSNVSVLTRARAPERPSKPKWIEDLLIAGALALFFGLVASFLIESLDNTLKNPRDVERYLGLPSLAVVPDFRIANGSPYAPSGRRRLTNGNGTELVVPGVSQGRFSTVAESYSTLRTALMLSRAGDPPRITLITSATRAEGKTVTAANTAMLFARTGARVLLLDADLRRPRCHRVFHIENRTGLCEVLVGQIEAEQGICSTKIDKLFLMTAGSTPPNPGELLGSTSMSDLLVRLRDLYDFVIIDSAPVILVSDALPLSAMVDGAVVVVNGPETPRHLVEETCSRLSNVGARLLGVVLNRVNTRSADYYYSGYYYPYHSYNRYEEDSAHA
jgi:capsular exopolysaccharide synthesis family protein